MHIHNGNILTDVLLVRPISPELASAQNLSLFAVIGTCYGKYALNRAGYCGIWLPYLTYWSTQIMAKAFAGTTFINVRLGASDKKAVDAWAKEVNYDPVEFMFVAISDNYKISVSADLDKDCVICSITGKQQRGINAMKTMTSRGPDIDTALLITAYKHLKMFGGGEWVDEGDGDSWG